MRAVRFPLPAERDVFMDDRELDYDIAERNKAGSIEAFLEKRNFREHIKNFVHSKSGRKPMIIFNISYVNGYSDDEYYGDT